VFWIHHEETQGVFDWSGDRDLRRFIECCAETGLFAIVRVGPFCHGEV
jgi:beta-galactosidase GanA